MCLIFRLNKYYLIFFVQDWLDFSLGNLVVALGRRRIMFLKTVEPHLQPLRNRLFPFTNPILLTTSMLNWFEMVTFSYPENILLDHSVEECSPGLVKYFRSLVDGSSDTRNINRKRIVKCLFGARSIQVKDAISENILKHCKSLERIHIQCDVNSLKFLIPVCGPLLQVLDLFGCHITSEQPLCSVCRKCPNLRVLRVSNSNVRFQSLYDTILVHCRQMYSFSRSERFDESVAMQRFFLMSKCRLRDKFTDTISRSYYWYRLETFRIFSEPSTLHSSIIENSLCDAVSGCKGITQLNISFGFNPMVVLTLIQNNQNLSRVTIRCDPLEVFPCLVTLSSRLLVLHLDELNGGAENLPVMLCLVRLNISFTNSAGLSPLLERCPQLQTLSLSHCTICDALGASLFAIPLLTKVDLTHSMSISEEFLIQMGTHCPLVNELHLTECKRILDVGLCHVIRNGNLTYLDIASCTNISTYTLDCLAKHCRGLKYFIFYYTLINLEEAQAALGHIPGIELVDSIGGARLYWSAACREVFSAEEFLEAALETPSLPLNLDSKYKSGKDIMAVRIGPGLRLRR